MVARLLLVLGLLAAATPALADGDNVVVLGLRSIEGDDDVANDVTDRLREGVATVPGWIASPTAVSMSQMSLAHGCDELDAACLGDIARGLQADRIIYGTVRRTTAREDYDFALGLSLYDAQAGAITKQVDDTVPRAEANYDALGPRVEKLLGRLSSTLQGGAIAVQVNVPDADVRVNGQSVGKARDGSLRLEGLQDGQYRIEVHKDGFTPHVSTVTIVEGTETMLSAVLNREGIDPADYPAEASSGHELAWLGWSLLHWQRYTYALAAVVSVVEIAIIVTKFILFLDAPEWTIWTTNWFINKVFVLAVFVLLLAHMAVAINHYRSTAPSARREQSPTYSSSATTDAATSASASE